MAGEKNNQNKSRIMDDVDDLKKIIHKNKLQKHVLQKILEKHKSKK